MVGYKLSKNDWVTPFFVIFRSVREKLLVTVFFDHPVVLDSLEYTEEVAIRRLAPFQGLLTAAAREGHRRAHQAWRPALDMQV